MPLSVIGAGFGRTGTMSLKLALEMLGVGPCYHMLEVRKNPSHRPVWLQATRHQPVDWDALFIDYNSGVDWPIATFWRELSEYYPDAKFILTQRDPQRWYKSISNTIFKSLTGPPEDDQERRVMPSELILERTFGGKHTDEQYVIDTYLAHNQAVIDILDRDRLLVYDTGSGWGPLCEFLGLPVPEEDYPNTNSTAEFQSRMQQRTGAAPSPQPESSKKAV